MYLPLSRQKTFAKVHQLETSHIPRIRHQKLTTMVDEYQVSTIQTENSPKAILTTDQYK